MDNPKLKIGLMSGLNYLSVACREGLWQLASQIFMEEKVNFIVLAGGLVDARALNKELKERLKAVKKEEREDEQEKFLNEVAIYLKERIPVISGVKIYALTSPAYDGILGEDIARRLVEMRRDILLYREGGDRLELKQLGKMLGVYAPKKGVWMRGDYYDTPVLRILKDEIKRSSRGIGDIVAVGCHASAVFHPGASSEIKKPYMSLPSINKIDETRTAENQIGVRILEFYSNNPQEAHLKTYSFKDVVSDEWALVQAPRNASQLEKNLIDMLKHRGPLTVGQFEDFSRCKRGEIESALEALVKRRPNNSWPGVYKDEASDRYYFNMGWFGGSLMYPKLTCGDDKEDSFLAFACLHAGCKHTDMKFFRDVVPEIVLKNDIKYLVGAGDFIEGLKHDLMLKGELVVGSRHSLNYTNQEKLSAYLVGSVIVKVFKERLKKLQLKKRDTSEQIKNALMDFLYIPGNHCGWTEPLGFEALTTFRAELKSFIIHHVTQFCNERGICANNLNRIVSEKLISLSQVEPYKLPSGLSVSLLHPFMSRTKTTSIRPQEMLAKANTQIVIGGNFHVAESVDQWEFELGQRTCLQLGTLKVKSGFEDTKLKTVDFGVGLLKVISANQRIKKTEVAFYGEPSKDLVKSNAEILKDFDEWMSLDINKQ